jgi:hypothetical protein
MNTIGGVVATLHNALAQYWRPSVYEGTGERIGGYERESEAAQILMEQRLAKMRSIDVRQQRAPCAQVCAASLPMLAAKLQYLALCGSVPSVLQRAPSPDSSMFSTPQDAQASHGV